MRPKSIDDVRLAYEMAVRDLHAKQDGLKVAAGVLARVQADIAEQNRLVEHLRSELDRFVEVAA